MIRIGVVGAGYWGKHHLRVFRNLNCELIGMFDLDKSKQVLADQYSISFFSNYEKLLDQVDAVTIVTPPKSHYALAKRALSRGKHVLLEKPFVTEKKQAQELIKIAKGRNLTLMIGHIYLYHPAILELKRRIESQEMGRLYYLISQRLNLGIVRSDVNALWNFAPHDLSIACYLFDQRPIFVSCEGRSYLQKGIEDVTFTTLTFPNNICVHLILSWLHPLKVRQITLVGSKKMAVFDDTDNEGALKIYDKSAEPEKLIEDQQWNTYGEFKMKLRFGDVTTPVLKSIEPLAAEGQDFLKAIETSVKPRSHAEAGYEIVAILNAASKSLIKGGKNIEIAY